MNERALAVIKNDLSHAGLFLLIILRASANRKREIRIRYEAVCRTLRGMQVSDGRKINLDVRDLQRMFKHFAYLGIIQVKAGAEPNKSARTVAYHSPVTITQDFFDLLPKNVVVASVQEYMQLRSDFIDMENSKGLLLNDLRRLRAENKELSSGRQFNPDFKIKKKDGSINQNSVQFRKLWALFILLEIDDAFVKTVADDDKIGQTLDYGLLATWISKFGMETIEPILMRFYENGRLDEIKETSDNWRDSIRRFLYGAFKKSHQESPQDGGSKDRYEGEDTELKHY